MSFQDMKLGLLPPTPDRPALKVSDFLTGIIPKVPEKIDYMEGLKFPIFGNNSYGVCGPVSVAHDRICTTSKISGVVTSPSQEDIWQLYRHSGNTNFDPNLPSDHPRQEDNGVNMQTMLTALNKFGIGARRCMAFARVDAKDIEELKISIAVFGCVLFGVDLQVAQQDQTDNGVWTYSPSKNWGGHAVAGMAYANGIDIATWGKRVKMSDGFIKNQSSEAWVVIFPEHFSEKTFMEGVDFKILKGGYEKLTGRRFPSWELGASAFNLI